MGEHLRGRARPVDGKLVPIYTRKLGLRLRDARLERGIPIVRLAAAAGAHPVTVRRIEAGARTTKLDTLIRLALALELSPSELLP